eukprot:scaffold653854_cov78-Prasinocladus_malaysianus.AAC.1
MSTSYAPRNLRSHAFWKDVWSDHIDCRKPTIASPLMPGLHLLAKKPAYELAVYPRTKTLSKSYRTL